MTSELQQALLDDDLAVVQKKIDLGSYPHAVYAKARQVRAWKAVQWIASEHPGALVAQDWYHLATNDEVKVPGDVLRLAHQEGVVQKPSAGWKRSVVAWERQGIEFSVSFYNDLWLSTGIWQQTRQYVFQLGVLHRFDAVQTWLDSTREPRAKDIQDLYKQFWDHAILHCDNVLIRWLLGRATRWEQMKFLYNGVTVSAIALNSALARRSSAKVWDVDIFLDNAIDGWFIDIDDFCLHVALYDGRRLRHIWSTLQLSQRIPAPWRTFFASGATLPVPGDEQQRLVMVLHGMFPNDEAARMQQCVNAQTVSALPQTDLVDLL